VTRYVNLHACRHAGIWSDPDYDRTDINTVCSSNEILAIGDDCGRIKVHRFPCPPLPNNPPPGATWKSFTGHGAHVMCVRFAPDGKYLYSAGGRDRTVMQWRVTPKAERPAVIAAKYYGSKVRKFDPKDYENALF
jgi:WD40 repeat protein